MPEPDFEQIATRLLDDLPDAFITRGASDSVALPGVVNALRQVWNARGAADIAALEPIIGKLGDTMDPENARAFVVDALRTLDR